MSIAEIKKMTVRERLAAMELLWDSLCQAGSAPESPSCHEDVLKERKTLMDSPDATYMTMEELRDRFR